MRNNILRNFASISGLLCVGIVFPAAAQNTADALTIKNRVDQWIKPYVLREISAVSS